MKKKRWKTVAISMGTLLILSIVVFLVFRGHYQAIAENIALIRITDLMFLLGLGVIYQTIESSICFVLVRNQLPDFTFKQANAVTYLGVFGKANRKKYSFRGVCYTQKPGSALHFKEECGKTSLCYVVPQPFGVCRAAGSASGESVRRLSVCMPVNTPASRARFGFPAFSLKLFLSKARWNYCACSMTIWSNRQKGVI